MTEPHKVESVRRIDPWCQGCNPDGASAYQLCVQHQLSGFVARAAVLSDDGLYRYVLHRWWGSGENRLTFVMLNPSTADARVDDPTIRRCIGFARTLGYDGIRVANLYAFRATKPADLWRAEEPTGGDRNDDLLRELLRQGRRQPVIAAWGANARPERVAEFMSWHGSEHVQALGLTKAGAPRHPLYLRADAVPVPYLPPGSDGQP